MQFLIGGAGISEQKAEKNRWFLGNSYESWQEWLDQQAKNPLSRA